MATLGAHSLSRQRSRPIAMPIEPRLSQQDGFLHAGVVVAALDSACGYAALTRCRRRGGADRRAKVNLLAPASGDSLVAEGEVVRAGRTLTVCRGDAHAEQGPSACTWRRCSRPWCVGAPAEPQSKANSGGRTTTTAAAHRAKTGR